MLDALLGHPEEGVTVPEVVQPVDRPGVSRGEGDPRERHVPGGPDGGAAGVERADGHGRKTLRRRERRVGGVESSRLRSYDANASGEVGHSYSEEARKKGMSCAMRLLAGPRFY